MKKKFLLVLSITVLLISVVTILGIGKHKKTTLESGNAELEYNKNAELAGQGNLNQTEESYSFYAYVTTSNYSNNYMIVMPEVNTKEYNVSDNMWVYWEKEDYPVYKPGTYIKITYDGIIGESYPAKIEASNIEFIREPLYQ